MLLYFNVRVSGMCEKDKKHSDLPIVIFFSVFSLFLIVFILYSEYGIFTKENEKINDEITAKYHEELSAIGIGYVKSNSGFNADYMRIYDRYSNFYQKPLGSWEHTYPINNWNRVNKIVTPKFFLYVDNDKVVVKHNTDKQKYFEDEIKIISDIIDLAIKKRKEQILIEESWK